MLSRNSDEFSIQFNERLMENERIFKLSKAILDAKDELVVQLLVNADDYDKFLNDDLRKKVNKTIGEIIGKPRAVL